MTTGKRPKFHLQSENIQQWQISTCEDDELALPTVTISALYNGIVGFLKVVTNNVRKNEPCPSYFSTLEQAAAALFFWGRDFGVPQGELDTALQSSNRLRDTVLTILASLGDLSTLGNTPSLAMSVSLTNFQDSYGSSLRMQNAKHCCEQRGWSRLLTMPSCYLMSHWNQLLTRRTTSTDCVSRYITRLIASRYWAPASTLSRMMNLMTKNPKSGTSFKIELPTSIS